MDQITTKTKTKLDIEDVCLSILDPIPKFLFLHLLQAILKIYGI
jgi:hypothetical protein